MNVSTLWRVASLAAILGSYAVLTGSCKTALANTFVD
jgi:hypothetical protein